MEKDIINQHIIREFRFLADEFTRLDNKLKKLKRRLDDPELPNVSNELDYSLVKNGYLQTDAQNMKKLENEILFLQIELESLKYLMTSQPESLSLQNSELSEPETNSIPANDPQVATEGMTDKDDLYRIHVLDEISQVQNQIKWTCERQNSAKRKNDELEKLLQRQAEGYIKTADANKLEDNRGRLKSTTIDPQDHTSVEWKHLPSLSRMNSEGEKLDSDHSTNANSNKNNSKNSQAQFKFLNPRLIRGNSLTLNEISNEIERLEEEISKGESVSTHDRQRSVRFPKLQEEEEAGSSDGNNHDEIEYEYQAPSEQSAPESTPKTKRIHFKNPLYKESSEILERRPSGEPVSRQNSLSRYQRTKSQPLDPELTLQHVPSLMDPVTLSVELIKSVASIFVRYAEYSNSVPKFNGSDTSFLSKTRTFVRQKSSKSLSISPLRFFSSIGFFRGGKKELVESPIQEIPLHDAEDEMNKYKTQSESDAISYSLESPENSSASSTWKPLAEHRISTSSPMFEDKWERSTTFSHAYRSCNVPDRDTMWGPIKDYYCVLKDHPCPSETAYADVLSMEKIPVVEVRSGADVVALCKFRTLISQLKDVNPGKLSEREKIPFWINLYNALVMQVYLEFGILESRSKFKLAMKNSKWNIGGYLLNSFDIEYKILRVNSNTALSRSPFTNLVDRTFRKWNKSRKLNSLAFGRFRSDDPRSNWVLKDFDPSINFALTLGAHSSPALQVYTATNIKNELFKAKEEYILASIGILKSKKILLPKLFQWYWRDFVPEESKLMGWVTKHMPHSQRLAMLDCIMEYLQYAPLSKYVEFYSFDWRFRYLLGDSILDQNSETTANYFRTF